MMKLERREHGCDSCHKDVPTEMFLGYCKNCLWICTPCRLKLTGDISKQHNYMFKENLKKTRGLNKEN